MVLALLTAFTVGTTMLLPAEVSAASRPGQVKSLKVSSAGYNSLTVSWKRVKNAKGYQIYRATKKNGKYKKIKTIKKPKTVSWTNKKLTTGKRYYYKVRAYKGSRKGKFSVKKSGVPTLSKTSVTVKVSSSSEVKVSWNKVSGAKGYQVYRATSSKGSYSKIKTTSATSFTNTGLAANKTYYYKVRSYRKVGKSTKYSSFSSVKSAKTKAKPAAPAKPNPKPPTTPTNPDELSQSKELYIVEKGKTTPVTTLQAGKVYDVLPEYDAEGYRIRWDIRLPGHMGTDFDSLNLPSQVCYARGYLYPVAQGSFYLINRETGAKRLYQVTKGTVITTGGMEIELGGPVPSGASESYATIYGYQQYVYKKDTKELILIGAEGGTVKTIFTMGDYSMNTDEEYLEVKTASFGGTTIQPIRYYQYHIPSEKIHSGILLDGLGHEANLIGNAIRVKAGKPPMEEKTQLAEAAKQNVNQVYNYYGSCNWDSNTHMKENDQYYFDALKQMDGVSYSLLSDNAHFGDCGAYSAAVSAIEGIYTSSGHKVYLLSDQAEIVGAAFMYDGNNMICMLQAYAYKRN